MAPGDQKCFFFTFPPWIQFLLPIFLISSLQVNRKYYFHNSVFLGVGRPGWSKVKMIWFFWKVFIYMFKIINKNIKKSPKLLKLWWKMWIPIYLVIQFFQYLLYIYIYIRVRLIPNFFFRLPSFFFSVRFDEKNICEFFQIFYSWDPCVARPQVLYRIQ